jgi:peptidoglycan/xylan/chitin deacetylase (PgdA/CDA1 family)/lipoprotein-anchoring transpeptidase ErfK/SrfK
MLPLRRLPAAPVALALAASVLAGAPARVAAAGFPPTEWVVGPHQPLALITFDGHTKGRYLDRVLDTLKSKGAKASFFMAGRWIQAHPTRARLIADRGHRLGNRGYGTASFTSLDEPALRASIRRAQSAIDKIGASPAPFLRAPNGARDLRVLQIAGSMGYRSVHWTHNPGGGKAVRVQRAVVRKARYGSIVSLDIWRASHRSALPGIIDGLRRRGFELGTVNRLSQVHPIRYDVTLKAGSTGPEVAYLQKILKQRSYPAGEIDGSFGYATLQAVYAFEKVYGLTRDGVVPTGQMLEIARKGRPAKPNRRYHNFIDVDISRQVLFEVRDDKVIRTLPISSGNEEYYTVDGQTYKAHTPRGEFRIQRKIAGKRVSRLGTLWWPSYFTGGYAIHGSDSVPTYPASHGCIRIPRYVERAFFYRNPVERPVFVHN